MHAEQPELRWSKALLGGLFAGIVAALVNMIFIIAFRWLTQYDRFEVASALVIFTFFPALLFLFGGFYYLVVRHLERGTLFFSITLIGIMLALLLFTWQDAHWSGRALNGRDGLLM